jgi:phosphoglycerol transferase MdoB-like AlkP superfamily enzyme
MPVVGPLGPLLGLAFVALIALGASRMILLALYWDRLRDVAGVWRIVPIGARVDAMALGWLLLPVAIVLVSWPGRIGRRLAAVTTAYLALVAGTLAFFEAATYPFVAQYDSRPNRIFLDYLRYPREVLGTVWVDHKLAIMVGLVVVAAVVRAVFALRVPLARASTAWSWRRRLVVGPIVLTALFIAARSGFAPRGGNISTAAFSSDHLANELALDSTYAVGYALQSLVTDEVDPERLYGRLDRREAIDRVRAGMLLSPSAFPNDDVPFLHHQAAAMPRARPFNLVIFLQESLGAEYVGALGGLPLTPNLDALAREGLLLTNLFATGTRTVRGIEAVVSGFLPTPGSGVVKLGLAQNGFFTAASLLRRRGYATDFIYGGASNFDNMRGFFLNNGFDRVIDEAAFTAPAFRGIWGVSDEDLVRRANATFVAHGEHPFFALMLSTSNHPPFEYPPNRITLFEEPPNTLHNAIKYADSAIGDFFRLAEREPYFARTVFLVVADHDTRVYGRDLVPIGRFHIPGLVIAPGLAPRRDDGLASQVDLLPTVLDLMGLDVDSPLMGRDLISISASAPGHAFMQYNLTNAYRVGDDVVVLAPYKRPQQFRFEDDRLRPAPLAPELVRDAIAHVQVPAMLYRERRYRLPESDGRQG